MSDVVLESRADAFGRANEEMKKWVCVSGEVVDLE